MKANSRDRSRRRCLLAAGLAWAIIGTGAARAQVDCSNPDNLCTGDPCVVGKVEVQSPCVADFGARTLVLDGTIFVPNGGVLDLTADHIDLQGRIKAGHTRSTGGDGGQVSLAANFNLNSAGKIDVSGRYSPGSLALTAGNDLTLSKPVLGKSRGGGATAPAASVTLQAGGTLTGTKRAKIKLKGKRTTDGGQLSMSGQAGVSYEAKIDVRGLNAGSVSVTSGAGDIAVLGDVRGDALEAAGGSAAFAAAGDVRVDDVDMSGRTDGGSVLVLGATVSFLGHADVDGPVGGSIDVIADGDALVGKLAARSKTSGSTISIAAGGALELVRITARGAEGPAANVLLRGEGGVEVGQIKADARSNGGLVTIESGDPLNPLSGPTLTVNEDITASGVDGNGGEIRITSYGGDAVVGLKSTEKFSVEGQAGGIIEVVSLGQLTAKGMFAAQTGGCIGMFAPSTDLSEATFDVPLSLSPCP